ncbi:MAG: hypothetical protein WBB01_02255 [Phormidesmis sp.]
MPPILTRLLAWVFARIQSFWQGSPRPEPIDQRSTEPAPSKKADSDALADLQREIRAERQFSLAEAIGREGGSFMKGESTVPRPLRAATEVSQFITTHLADPTGPVSTTLYDWASSDIRLSRQLDTPLVALAQVIESILAEPTTLSEFARQVAIAHSHITGDRPYFQKPDAPPHPQASYTHASIAADLAALLDQVEGNSLSNL